MVKAGKRGGGIPPHTQGGKWNIVEDLEGLPSHANGGVALSVQDGKVSFSTNGGDIYAANGAVIPKQEKVPVSPTYKYEDTKSKYDKFRSELENDNNAKDRARLSYYKTVLDQKLKAADPTSFDTYSSQLPKNLKERIAFADQLYQDKKYNKYVAPDEIKKTLGSKYDDYVTLMKSNHKDSLGIAGSNESGDLTDLNYGLRTSASILPFRSGYGSQFSKDDPRLKVTFGADVVYDAKSNNYQYKYSEPKEF